MLVCWILGLILGLFFWSFVLYNYEKITDNVKTPMIVFTVLLMFVSVLGIMNGTYNLALGYIAKQNNLTDGNYYELVCQATKDDKHIVVLKHLGNDGIKAYYLDELLPEGKKHYKAVQDQTTSNTKILLVPAE